MAKPTTLGIEGTVKRKFYEDVNASKVIIRDVNLFASYADSILEIQVEYLDKSDILVLKLHDAVYIKVTLQIHHLKRVGKSKGNFYYNSTYKKWSSLLRAVDYAVESTPDSDMEELDKPSEDKKDEPFTEAVGQYDALEVTIGNIVVVLYKLRKKQLKYLGVVQSITGNCVSVQFLKCSGEKTFSIRDGEFNDCLCCHIKAVIKEGQFTMNTRGQYLIEERYFSRSLSM